MRPIEAKLLFQIKRKLEAQLLYNLIDVTDSQRHI